MANDTESTTSTQRPAWYPGMWISRLYHGEGGSSSQRHQSPDIEKLPLFLYLLRTDYPDLWEECEKRGVTIAVPRAATIGNFTESVHFEAHLLVPRIWKMPVGVQQLRPWQPFGDSVAQCC